MRTAAIVVAIAAMALLVPPIDACARDDRCGDHVSGEWPAAISLAGPWRYRPASLVPADAYRPDFNDSAWREMRVPSNWFLEGLDQAGAVWFRRSFDTPSRAGASTQLGFDGIDYAADVWVNGHYAGFHEGYFERFAVDVGSLLRTSGPNVVAVRVDSPLEQGTSWSLHKRLIKGVFAHHDARPGNAWSDRGQEQNTGGIWGNVWLKPGGRVALDGIRVIPDAIAHDKRPLTEGGTARLSGSVTVTNTSMQPRRLHLRLSVAPLNFMPARPSTAAQTLIVDAAPGRTTVAFDVKVPNASLWWMWEHGRPNLYRLSTALFDNDARVDVATRDFGFRSITFDPASGDWRLNGRPVFLRGTNYIASQWLSEMTPDAYRRDLALMKVAGINAIRVHAHVEGEELYRQADENGLLVWQDFPLQWGYRDDAEFVAEAVRQSSSMVAQLAHHPSIAAWSAHNEPPWDASWMKGKYPDYNAEQNRALDAALARAMRARDPSRHVHLASTTAEHPWFGWYSGSIADYAKPTAQRLITEFGAQALPDLSSLRLFIRDRDLWPTTDAQWATWEYHDFQPKETFTLAKVPRGATIDALIANTQRYQARLVQFAAESYRRQKHAPVGAIFQFMFNECWPSANWGVVDYWRHPKEGFQAMALAYQPVLPSIAWTPGQLLSTTPVTAGLWIVNDLWREFPGATLHWAIRSAAGEIVNSGERRVDVGSDSVVPVETLHQALPQGEFRLDVALVDGRGVPLGNNHWSFTIEDPR